MSTTDLLQSDADVLTNLEKHSTDNNEWDYPTLGGSIRIPLVSVDKRENFHLDITRGSIELTKATYQHRARIVYVLLRLDINGGPHRNPDDQEVMCPHLHIYREGYGDKWAYPLPTDRFAHADSLWETLEDFMRYCNITVPPNIRRGLFV